MKSGLDILKIDDRNSEIIKRLFKIWRSSARATHFFVSDDDLNSIAGEIPRALREIPHLVVAYKDGVEAGFAGVDKNRLEMLFVSPKNFKNGVGSALLNYVFKEYNVNEVCVNEQNEGAIKFYEKVGFKPYKRTPLDEQGRSYPIIYMKVQSEI